MKESDVCRINGSKFIVLVDKDVVVSNYNIVKLKNTSPTFEVGVPAGTEMGKWKVWGASPAEYTYTVQDSDAYPKTIANSTQYAYYDGTGVGDSVEWKVVDSESNRLEIKKELTYTTTLYFAGPSKDPKALLRSADTVVNTSSDIRIDADWESFESGKGFKITLKPNTDDGGVGDDYVYYTGNDHSLVLPENMFTNSNDSKKFVGWKDADLGKIYSPWYVFGETEQDRTLIAQWSTTYLTVTFDEGTGPGTMPVRYVVSGNTFTLPLCSYAAPANKMFTGWVVTGNSGRDYSSFDQPMETITNLTESITVTAQWSDILTGCHKVTIDNLGYNVYTDENGRYTLPHNILLPPANPSIEGFTGWVFSGWKVTKEAASKMVAQGHSDPINSSFYIIDHGVIKFKYDSGEAEP